MLYTTGIQFHNIIASVILELEPSDLCMQAQAYTRMKGKLIPLNMADADLEAIRASRLAQMQGEQIGGGESDAKLKAEQARKAAEQQENMKNSILHQVLDQSAMARLSNLRAAKPEKAAIVENTIIQMARMGQIASKMSDEALKELLDRISEKTHKTTTVKTKQKMTVRRAPRFLANDDPEASSMYCILTEVAFPKIVCSDTFNTSEIESPNFKSPTTSSRPVQ
ncbi:Programmed cell death protein 5 [Toxocara canis]|uniref:Programmed cell death protein 5 n=1 Tax=Toxocara canis TaxID=6265 RepID=A0A0B2VDB3_TOXCA|nr:Programmed cell death protein 5 [Toxocara canis]